MADVILKNAEGIPQTYTGVEEVLLDTPDGGKAAFVLDGVTTPEYIVKVGDALDKLYFNTKFDFGSHTQSFELKLLDAQKDSENRFELVWKCDSADIDAPHAVYAIITQGGVQTRTDLFGGLGVWLMPELDLSGYDIGTVTACLPDPSKIPMFTKSKLSFGLFPTLPPYLVAPGDTVNVLHFNPLSADAVTQLLPQLYAMSPKEVDADFGMSYTDLGLDMRIGDLSTVGLGSGYAIYSYSNKGQFLLFSTITFDASAIVPGFVVTAPGWQVESLEYKTPITANYDTIPWIVKTTGAMHMVWAKAPFSIDLSGIL